MKITYREITLEEPGLKGTRLTEALAQAFSSAAQVLLRMQMQATQGQQPAAEEDEEGEDDEDEWEGGEESTEGADVGPYIYLPPQVRIEALLNALQRQEQHFGRVAQENWMGQILRFFGDPGNADALDHLRRVGLKHVLDEAEMNPDFRAQLRGLLVGYASELAHLGLWEVVASEVDAPNTDADEDDADTSPDCGEDVSPPAASHSAPSEGAPPRTPTPVEEPPVGDGTKTVAAASSMEEMPYGIEPTIPWTWSANPMTGEIDARQRAKEEFRRFLSLWLENFDVKDTPQPDRPALMQALGSGRNVQPLLMWLYDESSLQERVHETLTYLGHPQKEDLDFVEKVAGHLIQVSIAGFPDLAGTYDHSTRWRRRLTA